jgi:hypothetical protein
MARDNVIICFNIFDAIRYLSKVGRQTAQLYSNRTYTTSLRRTDLDWCKVSAKAGDPTAGDSDITVYVNYRLIPA